MRVTVDQLDPLHSPKVSGDRPKRRAADPASSISGSTEIGCERYAPDRSMFPDL